MYAKRLAALKADPAAAAQARAERLAGEEGGSGAEGGAQGLTRERLLSARLAVQEADGLPASSRRLLTAQEREAMGEAWRSAGASERLALFESLRESFGRHAGRAFGELGLSPLEESLARSAAAAGSAEAVRGFMDLSEAVAMAEKDLPKLPPEVEAKAAREAIAGSLRLSVMQDMLERVMPGNSSLAGRLRAAQDGAERLLRLRGGDARAAVAALDAGVGALQGPNHALIFNTALTDEDTLETALAHVTRERLEGFGELRPAYAQGESPAERAAWLRRRGVWANAPDGDGFALFDPRSQAPIRDGKGNLFRLRESEAAAWAREAKANSGGGMGILP
jgi:hypothetical protein